MSLSQEPALYDARSALWYSMPSGVISFSKCCVKSCDNGARGGAFCPDCAESRLAAVIGPIPASDYAHAIRCLRQLESKHTEIIRNTP